jgi:hypothetical protein
MILIEYQCLYSIFPSENNKDTRFASLNLLEIKMELSLDLKHAVQ